MSIFSRIIAGEIPCFKVAEDENCFAFLDINPIAEGHTLVVPKKEVDYLFDLDDTNYLRLMAFAKKVSKAIKNSVECKRVGVAVLGMEVPHAHIHLIPLQKESDLSFSNPKKELSKDEMEAIARRISAQVVD
ncbi:HIT family hydrolase [Porphyromonadaceae bacterium COT-184 OH4590]|nr:HIT family hydrolase [Porphyromonadaceae bacterium COT-184 OH4590]